MELFRGDGWNLHVYETEIVIEMNNHNFNNVELELYCGPNELEQLGAMLTRCARANKIHMQHEEVQEDLDWKENSNMG